MQNMKYPKNTRIDHKICKIVSWRNGSIISISEISAM